MTIRKLFGDKNSAMAISHRAIELHLRQQFVEKPNETDGSTTPMVLAGVHHQLVEHHGQKRKLFMGLVP